MRSPTSYSQTMSVRAGMRAPLKTYAVISKAVDAVGLRERETPTAHMGYCS